MKNLIITVACMFMLVFAPIAGAVCECPGYPSPEPTNDVPEVVETVTYEGNAPIPARNCDTDWERATYPECCGLSYELLLQDHPYSYFLNDWFDLDKHAARWVTREFGVPCK